MTMKTKSYCSPVIAGLLLIMSASVARAADEPLADAKALFAAASFDGALAALDKLDGPNAAQPEALEYKVLCLLALGRSADAQRVTESLVTSVPTFAPAETDLSPRFVELLTETRRRIVPVVARRLLTDARDQFRAKKNAEAQRMFEELLTLASDAIWRDAAEADDLRTLASGFLDLIHGAAATAASPDAPASAVAVAAVVSPAQLLGEIVAPVAVSQAMPRWIAPDTVSALRTFHGAVKVRIGTDGHVVDASMATATHPVYDQLLLEAARRWVYKPAVRNGQPIEVDKVVEFYLRSK
jgi:TonB family protein